jgi:hypothetical protein
MGCGASSAQVRAALRLQQLVVRRPPPRPRAAAAAVVLRGG